MRRLTRALIRTALSSAVTFLAISAQAQGQAPNLSGADPSMLSGAPLARPMPGQGNGSFSRNPVFPLEPLPAEIRASRPGNEARPAAPVRKIEIVPGATPAVAAPVPAVPTAPEVQARTDEPSAPVLRRGSAPRRATRPPVLDPAPPVEPGEQIIATETIVRPPPPARAVVVREPSPAATVPGPPPTFLQPLSPTGSGSWYFYDQPTERGSPGRR